MKNILFVALLALTIASCKEADTTNPNGGNTNAGIEGTWNFTSYTQTNGEMKLDGVLFGTFSGESSNEAGTYEFTNDGKVNSNVGYTWTLTTTIAGVPQTQTQTVPMTAGSGTYTYNSTTKELTLVQNGETTVAEVTELTSSKCVMTFSYEQSQVVNGILTSSSMDNTITLTR